MPVTWTTCYGGLVRRSAHTEDTYLFVKVPENFPELSPDDEVPEDWEIVPVPMRVGTSADTTPSCVDDEY